MFNLITAKVDFNKGLDGLLNYWYTPSGLLISLILSFLLALSLSNQFHDINLTQILIAISFVCIIIIVWYYCRRLPKAAIGTVGFAISITTENKEERKMIASDLIETLQGLLVNSNYKYPFSFVIFPEHYASKLHNSKEVHKYMDKSKCHFIIYGRVRTRTIGKQEKYLLELEAAVSHAPLPEEVSRSMGNEFATIFPKKIHIAKEDDVIAFDATSEWISIVAKYMIGYAAGISGDLDYSQSLLEDVQRESQSIRRNIPVLRKIKSGLKDRLIWVYEFQSAIAHNSWRETRNHDELHKIRKILDKLEKLSPNNYRLRLLNSIYYFIMQRNTKKAKAELLKCKGVKDNTWQYSLAFLQAYDGHMPSAIQGYKSAFKHSVNSIPIDCIPTNAIPFETEEFICWILQNEPNRTQLHFCLGLINYHDKTDLETARMDFENFIRLTPSDKFISEIAIANEYIQKINEEGVLSNAV